MKTNISQPNTQNRYNVLSFLSDENMQISEENGMQINNSIKEIKDHKLPPIYIYEVTD